jgi:two-component system chemotaxis response regulator CheB
MSARDIVVIGASAGGVTVIHRLLSNLPSDFAAAVFVVLHRPSQEEDTSSDRLLKLPAFKSSLRARPALDGQRFAHGELYVAPPNMHLLVERGRIRLERSPVERRARPSVDVLFRSAAVAYGRRVAGVVLSGMLSDGSVGLWQIRKHGGITIVQDPDEAEYADMPRSAVDNVPVHYCLPVDKIAPSCGSDITERHSTKRSDRCRSASSSSRIIPNRSTSRFNWPSIATAAKWT